MSITLELKPETEAKANARAQARGVSVAAYLSSLIEESLEGIKDEPPEQFSSFEEWKAAFNDFINSQPDMNAPPREERLRAWDEFTNNPPLTNAAPLSDEAVSRESIYREREDAQL